MENSKPNQGKKPVLLKEAIFGFILMIAIPMLVGSLHILWIAFPIFVLYCIWAMRNDKLLLAIWAFLVIIILVRSWDIIKVDTSIDKLSTLIGFYSLGTFIAMQVIILFVLFIRFLNSQQGEARANSRYIPNMVKFEVFARDEGACRHCGSTENLELDHIHPFSRGGTSTADNLQLLCGDCNRHKSTKI